MNENLKNQSDLLYTQAKQQFDAIKTAYESGDLTTEVAVIQAAFESFQQFFELAGHQRFEALQFDDATPLWSEDYNGMMTDIYEDFEVLFREATLLADAMYVDFNHHVVQHDILSEKLKGIQNKMYDLAAYNSIEGHTTSVYAKEEFLNQDRIDYDKITMSPLTIEGGNVTLPQKSKKDALDKATISVLIGSRENTASPVGSLSNGYPGNNHEIVTSTKDYDSTGKSLSLNFLGSSNNRANYGALLDDNPNTWFEYEKIIPTRLVNSVSEKDYGFSYKTANDQYHYWTESLEDGVLRLCLEIQLNDLKTINAIDITMYTPANRLAQTAKVAKVLVIDEQNNSKNVAYSHTGTFFKFNAMKARAVQIFFEQEHAYTTEIGHIFYTKKYLAEDSNGYKQSVVNRIAEANNRIDGPIPWITDVGAVIEENTTYTEVLYAPKSKDSSDHSVDAILSNLRSQIGMEDVEMGVERIQADRYCIGIKDINIFEAEFEDEGELITKPFYFEKPLERISLDIDEADNFNASWLQYSVSIDDGITWHPITPLRRQERGIKTYIIQQVERNSGIIQKEGIIETDRAVYSIRIRIIGRVGEVQKQTPSLRIPTETPVLRTIEIQGGVRENDKTLTYVSDEEQRFFEKENPPIPPIEIIPPTVPPGCEICEEEGNTGQNPDDPEGEDPYNPETDPESKITSILKSDKYQICLDEIETHMKEVIVTYGAKSTLMYPIIEFRVEFDKFPDLNETILLKPEDAIQKISKDVKIDLSLLEAGEELIVKTYAKNIDGFEIYDEIMIEISETCDTEWNPTKNDKSRIEIDPRLVIGRVCEHTFHETGDLAFIGYVRSYQPIIGYEVYENDTVVASQIYSEEDDIYSLTITHIINKELYSLEQKTPSPYIIVYDAMGKKKKKSFRLTLKDCLGKNKKEFLYAEFSSAETEFCVDEAFSYKFKAGSSQRLRQVRVWLNGVEMYNKLYPLSSKSVRMSGTLRVPYNQLQIGTSTIEIEMVDAIGQIIRDSRVLTFVGDCAHDDVRRKNLIQVTGRANKNEYCPCGEDVIITGSIKVTPSLERVIFKLGDMAFEPSALNPLKRLDESVCEGGYPGPIRPEPEPEPEPGTDPEEWQPPTENCRVHFSGFLMIADDKRIYNEGNIDLAVTKAWVEDHASEFVGSGWAPSNAETFPKAIAQTFDGVAIGAGTRLEVWSEEGYQGEKIFDQVGPLIINNILWKSPMVEQGVKDSFDSNPELDAYFPPDKRIWLDLNPWNHGSLKITCSATPGDPPIEPGNDNIVTFENISSRNICNTNPSSLNFDIKASSEYPITGLKLTFKEVGVIKFQQTIPVSNLHDIILEDVGLLTGVLLGNDIDLHFKVGELEISAEIIVSGGNNFSHSEKFQITQCLDGYSSNPHTSNGVNQPSKDISYLASATMPSASSMNYWWDNITNSADGIRNNFVHGRNDWLTLSGAPQAKVPENDPFYQHLFVFSKEVFAGQIVLPEPFARFDSWWIANMPAYKSTSTADKYKRVMIYVTYKLRKWTYVDASASPAVDQIVNAYGIEKISQYANNVPHYGLHWIDWSDKVGGTTLAFVTDLHGSEASYKFLTYMNIEDQVYQGDILSIKSFRPYNWKGSVGESFYNGNYQNYIIHNFDPKYNVKDNGIGSATFDHITTVNEFNQAVSNLSLVETFIHEIGHTIAYYAHDAYPTKYPYTQPNKRRAMHDWDEWRNISGWPLFTDMATDAVNVPYVDSSGTPRIRIAKSSNTTNKTTTGKEAPVTPYAATHPSEDFAEAYVMYIVNPLFMKEQYPEKFNFMETYVKNLPKNMDRIHVMSVNHSEEEPSLSIEEMHIPSISYSKKEYELNTIESTREMSKIEKVEFMAENHMIKTTITEEDLDFIQSIEEFEIDENCGCRKRKGTKQAVQQLQTMNAVTTFNSAPMVFLEDISPVLNKISEELYSFEFALPYWFIYESGFRAIGKTYNLTVEAINSEGKSDKHIIKIKIGTCNEPVDPSEPVDPEEPTDPEEPNEEDCMDDVVQAMTVHYYDIVLEKFLSKRLSMLKGQESATARTVTDSLKNKFRVGYNLEENKAWIQKNTKGEFPGIMIAQVYLEVGPKDLSTTTKHYLTSVDAFGETENHSNLVVANGEMDFNTHYLYNDLLEFGDTSSIPKLIQFRSYFELRFDTVDPFMMCPQSHLKHKPAKLSDEITDDELEPPNCEQHKTIHVQYYDDVEGKLKDLIFNLVEGVGETHVVQARNGSRTTLSVLAGYSGNSKGPAISIMDSDEEDDRYFYVSAIGVGYTQQEGGVNFIYSDSIFYSTRDHEGQSRMLGGPKTLAELDWVTNGIVNKDIAPWVGSHRDMISTKIKLPDNPCNPSDNTWDELFPIPSEEIVNKEELEKNGVIKFESFVVPVFNNNIPPGEVESIKGRFRVRRTWKSFRELRFYLRYTFENGGNVVEQHPTVLYNGRTNSTYSNVTVTRDLIFEFRNMDHYGYGKVVKAEMFVELGAGNPVQYMQYPNYSIEIPVEQGNRNETVKFSMVGSTASVHMNAVCINRSVTETYTFDIAYRIFDAGKEIEQFGIQIRSSREVIGEAYRTYGAGTKIVNDTFPVLVDRTDVKNQNEPYYYAVPMVQFKGTNVMIPISHYQLELRTMKC